MNRLGELLKELRGKKSLREIAEITELSHTYISDIEKGVRRGTMAPINPSPDTLKRLAKAYNYPYNELLEVAGYIDNKFANKDEKDIAKRIEQFKNEIENTDGLAFDGEPMSEDAKESLIEAMEHVFRQTQRINKKYIPKKHRDKDN